MGIFSNGRGVSGFAGILKAISDDTNFQNTLIKDKASIDNTRANTALNKQSFDFNDVNNPIMIKAKELANKMNQQTYDQNALMNPLNVTGKQLSNTGLGFDNQGKQIKNRDDQDRFNAVETVRNSFANNPDALNDFNAKRALGSSSWGRTNNSASAKPQVIKNYNTEGKITGSSIINADGSATPILTPKPFEEVIANAVMQKANAEGANNEFDTELNNDAFYAKTDELYRLFRDQGMGDQQARSMAIEQMMPQVKKDGDWFSTDELVYKPSDMGAPQQQQYPVVTTDEEYLALPAGTTYIAGGQIRVKK
ncbi:MAG: hypothetical protein HOM11_01305 [Methylococcales bacterium]|jgi:hypothetical protein|nr:hypothetical protein [Methylococcales bacterium]